MIKSFISLNRVCNRCLKVDTEKFGSLQQSEKTNICDYCNQRPSVILHNPKLNKYSCMECDNRLERN